MLAAILEFLGSFLGGAGDLTNTQRGLRVVMLVLAVMAVLGLAYGLTQIF